MSLLYTLTEYKEHFYVIIRSRQASFTTFLFGHDGNTAELEFVSSSPEGPQRGFWTHNNLTAWKLCWEYSYRSASTCKGELVALGLRTSHKIPDSLVHRQPSRTLPSLGDV